jgi:hypothetical protein
VLKRASIILLAIFFVFTATGVISSLAAKEYMSVICDEDCGNQNSKPLQEILDDIEVEKHIEFSVKNPLVVSSKTNFFYHAQIENEISVNLISPPPELI